MGRKNDGIKIVCENRKARHDYFIHDTYEAGLVLQGTEVKSLRAGRANLKDSYGEIKNGEIYIVNMHISPYDHGNIFNHDERRPRKLLMHKAEIIKLFSKTKEKGFTNPAKRLNFMADAFIKKTINNFNAGTCFFLNHSKKYSVFLGCFLC